MTREIHRVRIPFESSALLVSVVVANRYIGKGNRLESSRVESKERNRIASGRADLEKRSRFREIRGFSLRATKLSFHHRFSISFRRTSDVHKKRSFPTERESRAFRTVCSTRLTRTRSTIREESRSESFVRALREEKSRRKISVASIDASSREVYARTAKTITDETSTRIYTLNGKDARE